MKIFRLILSAAILWGLTISCNNEIDLFPDDAPEVLYVLGCLDGTGGIQQVKIRRMIHGDGDATVMINDPAYYLPDKSLRVYLENASGQQFPLHPVLYPPQTGGLFCQDSNLIYELSEFTPVPGQACTLRIEDSVNGKALQARISVMAPASFAFPVKESVIHSKFDFTDHYRPFHITYTSAPAAVWAISVKYMDFMVNGDNRCRKNTFSGTPGFYGYGSREFTLEYLTNIFKNLIPEDPHVDFRMFYRFDFSIWTGDGVLSKYLDVSSGYTDNRKLSSGNIDGGMGLFFCTSHDLLKNVCPKEDFCDFLADT
ncbi:MAG: hypothetical protein WC865_16620, partial [Bacteroidales bacterium]